MPPLPIFILGTVILAWALALAWLRVRGRGHRDGGWARAAPPLLSEDDVARRIGAAGVRAAAMAGAGAGAVTVRSARAPGPGTADADPEPAVSRRARLWRDAAAVLFVSSLVLLAVTTVDPGLLPQRPRGAPNLPALAAVASATPAVPPVSSPLPAGASGPAPAPTLVLTSGATPGPSPASGGGSNGGGLDARDVAVTVLAAVPARIDVLASDRGGSGRPLAITAVSQPARGLATTDGTAVTYDPTGCAAGSDAFTYTVTDGRSSATRSVVVTIAGPGRDGFASTPVTDAPRARFIAGSTVGSTVPMLVSWCGAVATTVGGYTVDRSSDGGASWSPAFAMTTLTGSVRELGVGVRYAWRVRTTDASGVASGYATSPVSSLVRIEDTATSIRYAGPWQIAASTGYSGGTERYAVSPSARATLVVTGARAFAIVSSEVGTRGSFRVDVDGRQVAIVSERTASVRYRRVVFEGELAPGIRHTIVIRPIGDGRVDLDAILALQ